jgi:hypothetical protein
VSHMSNDSYDEREYQQDKEQIRPSVSSRPCYRSKNSSSSHMSRESLDESLPSIAGSSCSTSSDRKNMKSSSSSVCSRERRAHRNPHLDVARDLVSEANDYSRRRGGYNLDDN